MKRLVRFLRQYKLFSLAILSLIFALVLQLLGQQKAAHWLLAIVAIIEVLPLLWGMWQDIRNGTYGVDILAATAIIVSVILGEYWAGMVVVLMLTGGEALEDFAHHRAQAELKALLSRAPQQAHVLRKGKTLDVKVEELRVGEKIFIKPGEIVPVDAVILDGEASFDESPITGESLPQTRTVGSSIVSGSVNVDGAITAKAVSTAEDSQYQQIIKLVQGAASSQAPFVRLADRYALPFTLIAYAIAIGAWVVGGDPVRFLEVIVVATPCPLILAAPIALISGMARASKYGIIVKTGSAMERLAESKSMAFDKTGTLTKGELEVESIQNFNGYTSDQALQLAASLEQNSNHVVAEAIVSAAKSRKLKLVKAKNVQEVAGRGLSANLKGKRILVGRFSLMKEHGVRAPANFLKEKVSQTAVYVAQDAELVAVITFRDEVRPESEKTLARLHELGLHEAMMITGDNDSTAKQIAQELGIDRVYSEALPADKLRILEEAKSRPLAFVGDGVNDAPVLTGADVGIALGAKGSTAASESADMVIMLDDLGRVAMAYEIAKRTFQIAKQSILVGILLSVGLMVVFSTGKFTPLSGAIIQELVDVVVIFNALRAHIIKAENPSA